MPQIYIVRNDDYENYRPILATHSLTTAKNYAEAENSRKPPYANPVIVDKIEYIEKEDAEFIVIWNRVHIFNLSFNRESPTSGGFTGVLGIFEKSIAVLPDDEVTKTAIRVYGYSEEEVNAKLNAKLKIE